MSQRYQVVIGSVDLAQQQLQASLNRVLTQIEADIKPPRLSKAKLPMDDSIRLALVTDDVGGEVLAFLDSAGAWRRATDRAVIS